VNIRRGILIATGAIASIALVAGIGRVTDGPTPSEERVSVVTETLRADGVDVRGAYCEVGRCWVTLTTGDVRIVRLTEYEDGSYTIKSEDRP
jgi:hypothetical protein